MKCTLFLLFLLSATINLASQDYFWIGGEGNWSDLTHWATSSGGSEFHTALPDASSNVYFDKNSFTESGQKVFIDQDSLSCNDLSLSGIEFNPTFQSNDYYYKFFIHGNLFMTSELVWGVIQNHLVGNELTKIQIEKASMGGFLILEPKDSTAEFELLADITAQQIELLNGRFDTKDFNLTVNEIRIGSVSHERSPFFVLNNSNVQTSRFLAIEQGILDAGTSNVTIFDGPGASSNLFFGGGNNYHYVSFEGEIDRIKDNNHFVRFTVLPASILGLESGEKQTAEQFEFNGTSSSPISLSSRNEGEAAILEQEEGQVNGNYLVLKDIEAIGGADFNAFNSIDNGNVSGWDIQVTEPEAYYWVGNSGKWSDLNHWARSSGGDDFHIELPSAIDDVYFDANSVNETGAVIDVDSESILLDNFSLEGLRDGTVLQVSTEKMIVYGDVTFAENLDLFFNEVEFAGDSLQFITSNGTSWGRDSKLKFPGPSRVELVGDLSASEVSVSGGEFYSNGQSITAFDKVSLSKLNDPIINLDNSQIFTRNWTPSGSLVDLSIENTHITSYFIFNGSGFDYDRLTLDGRNWIYGPMFVDNLKFNPGAEVLIFPGDTVKFNDLEAIGTMTDSIIIASREDGEAGYLYSETGEVKGDYLIIRDNHALGGATFIAENSSVDTSSVVGWDVILSSSVNIPKFKASLYPNPVRSKLTISREYGDQSVFMITDLQGRLVKRLEANPSDTTLSIDVSTWQEGVYFVRGEGRIGSKKVVIGKQH